MKELYYRLRDRYDWWIYRRAYRSLARMSVKSPGFSYLMQLHLEEWNGKRPLPDQLKTAAESFHASLKTAEKAVTR
jgi:hypothetical protein